MVSCLSHFGLLTLHHRSLRFSFLSNLSPSEEQLIAILNENYQFIEMTFFLYPSILISLPKDSFLKYIFDGCLLTIIRGWLAFWTISFLFHYPRISASGCYVSQIYFLFLRFANTKTEDLSKSSTKMNVVTTFVMEFVTTNSITGRSICTVKLRFVCLLRRNLLH